MHTSPVSVSSYQAPFATNEVSLERWGIYHPDNAQTDKNAGATSNLKEETEWEVVEDEEAVVDDEMTISEHETAINEDETTQELQLTRMPGSWIPEVSRTIRDYCCRRFDRRIILP